MTNAEERRWRLTVTCLHAQVSKEDVAAAMGMTGGALAQWERRGDGVRKNALTAERIAGVLSQLSGRLIPPEALQAGSAYQPEWVKR